VRVNKEHDALFKWFYVNLIKTPFIPNKPIYKYGSYFDSFYGNGFVLNNVK